jgi:hypothetical protein
MRPREVSQSYYPPSFWHHEQLSRQESARNEAELISAQFLVPRAPSYSLKRRDALRKQLVHPSYAFSTLQLAPAVTSFPFQLRKEATQFSKMAT